MTGWSLTLGAVPAAGCVAFDEPGNKLWYATSGGEVRSLRIMDGRELVHGGGYDDVVAVIPEPDGLAISIAQRDGQIFRAARAGASRMSASARATVGESIVGAVADPDGVDLLVLTEAGELLRMGNAATVESLGEFDDAKALAIDPVARLAFVMADSATGRNAHVVELDSASVRAPMAVPSETTAIHAARLQGAAALLTASGATGQLTLLGLEGQPTSTGDQIGASVTGLVNWHSLVLAVAGQSLEAREWNLEAGDVEIALARGPLFVGGYAKAEADLAAAGLTRADVEFFIEEGADGGSCSAATEPDASSGRTRFVLLSGMHEGEYHVAARRISDGKFLGRARFRVTALWPDEDIGPGIAVTGRQQVFRHGSWGGGPSGPQNVDVHPAPDIWRVLVVLVETKDKDFGAAAAPAKTLWRDHVVGSTNSAKAYYEETSLFNQPGPPTPRGTSISLTSNGVLGPVALGLGWGDIFEPKKMGDTWGGWNPKSTFPKTCASKVSEVLQDQVSNWDALLRACDAIVLVVRTASDDKVTIGDKDYPAKFVWPQAKEAKFWSKTQFSAMEVPRRIVFMNDSDPASMPADKKLPSLPVLCHELGHTLDLEDLYNRGDYPAEVEARAIGELDFMGSEFTLPHASIANKLRLGWIPPTWIDTFDFGKNPAGRTVTLQAVESLTRNGPPPGRAAGIEVRVRDGWNYYFEYRRTIAGQMADQGLATMEGAAQLVLGTDVSADGAAKPARPVIMRLGVDADGNGPVLTANSQDYEETDVTNPGRAHDFRLIFDSIDAVDPNACRVRVEYISAHRPELQISPPPGRGDWKSPDIDITGPGGNNKVAKGRRHKVLVRVKNAGTLAAKSVRVGVSWLPFTTSPGAWTNLADPPRQDIAAGATVQFEQDWDVPETLKVDKIEVEHFCVKASVDAYVDPLDASNSEIVVFNNWAQSNFDSTSVSQGSPSERRWTGVLVSNTLPARATYLTVPEQDNDHFRAFVGNAWVRLAPHESRMVEVAYESLAGDPVHGKAFDAAFRKDRFERPNRLSFNSFVVREDANQCTSPAPVWGAGLALRPGRRTWIEELRARGEVVRGRVRGSNDGITVVVGQGSVNVVLWTQARPHDERVVAASVDASGWFAALVPGDILAAIGQTRIQAEALFLGTLEWAPCRSGAHAVA